MNYTNKKRSIAKELTTSTADIYQVPNAFKTEVTSIWLSNNTGVDRTVTFSIYYDADATTFAFATDLVIPANTVVQFEKFMFLDKNDKITGSCDANSAVTMFVNAEEFFTQRT